MKKLLSTLLSVFVILSTFNIIYVNKTKACENSEKINFDIHIRTPEDFKRFIDNFNDGLLKTDCSVILDENIEIEDRILDPIGTPCRPFSGIFDGNLKSINLSVDEGNFMYALFGYTNNATLKNIIVNGHIISEHSAGIVIDARSTEIYNCSNYANIRATKYAAAGIALYLYNCTVSDCCNGGTIYSVDNAGGIVFVVKKSNITNCSNYAPIYCSYGFLGGIVSIAKTDCQVKSCDIGDNCLFLITREGEENIKTPMDNFMDDIDEAINGYNKNKPYLKRNFGISKSLVGLSTGENVVIEGSNIVDNCVGVYKIEQ